MIFKIYFGRGKGREKERERITDRLPLVHAPTGDQTCNPGLRASWELNWRPFALQDDAQPTEPHRSGLGSLDF